MIEYLSANHPFLANLALNLMGPAKRRLWIAFTLTLIALPRHGAAEEVASLPRHDARLGLTFGIAQSEVLFQEIGRPAQPERPERKAKPSFGLPSIYLPTEEERSQEQAYQWELKTYEEIVAGCETTFDAIYSVSAGDTAWVTWEEERFLYEEIANLSPPQILEEEEQGLFEAFPEETKARV